MEPYIVFRRVFGESVVLQVVPADKHGHAVRGSERKRRERFLLLLSSGCADISFRFELTAYRGDLLLGGCARKTIENTVEVRDLPPVAFDQSGERFLGVLVFCVKSVIPLSILCGSKPCIHGHGNVFA